MLRVTLEDSLLNIYTQLLVNIVWEQGQSSEKPRCPKPVKQLLVSMNDPLTKIFAAFSSGSLLNGFSSDIVTSFPPPLNSHSSRCIDRVCSAVDNVACTFKLPVFGPYDSSMLRVAFTKVAPLFWTGVWRHDALASPGETFDQRFLRCSLAPPAGRFSRSIVPRSTTRARFCE